MRLLHEEKGYSMAFWAVTLTLVMLPMMALGIEVGRYARAAGEVQKAADAAALAAVREVDIQAFRERGEFRFKPGAAGMAQAFANANASYLAGRGISVYVTGMSVDSQSRSVYVACAADVSPLFPAWAPRITIRRTGTAEAAFR